MVNGVGTGHIHRIHRIGHRLQMPTREVQVKGGVPKFDMTEQQLNAAQVGTCLQEMRCIAVTAMSSET